MYYDLHLLFKCINHINKIFFPHYLQLLIFWHCRTNVINDKMLFCEASHKKLHHEEHHL